MRLIDADALIPMMKYATTDNEIGIFPIKIGFDAIVKVIEEQSTIEPEPQIVRCKDCKYYRCDGCFFSTAETEEDGFCSWAERKDGSCHEPLT